MKIAFVQFYPEFGRKEENFEKVEQLLSGVEADLVVLPELFSTGYLFEDKEELATFAEPFPDGESMRFLRDLSSEEDFALVGGFAEKQGKEIYNSSALVTPEGESYLYRKLHLFDRERLYFTPGNKELEPFEYKGVKIGLLVCFDWIFPEAYRTLALKGTQILCHSTNLVLPYCQRATVTRALENRMFIVVSNRYGSEQRAGEELTFTGQSEIVDPDGNILVDAGENNDAVEVVNIDPDKALDKNITERNHTLEDRRPDFYEL